MSLYVPIAFFLAAILESLLVGSLALWWICRLLKLSSVSARRALGVNLASIALSLAGQALLALLAVWAVRRVPSPPVIAALVQLTIGFGALAAYVAAQIILFARLLPASKLKAFVAWIAMNIPVVAINLGLAFVFRTALVEAFVVPAGAMAPTILGAHADRVCKRCGYAFAVGLSRRLPPTDADAGDWNHQINAIETSCPNCRLTDKIGVDVPLLPGDRILVDKQLMPLRWELAVIRYPEERSVTFVKRLVGLPGEALEIVAGDVFVDGQRLHKQPHTAQDLWLHVNDTAFRAKSPAPEAPGWRPRDEKSTWREHDGLWIGGDREDGEDVLDYAGPITDFEAYNGQEDDSQSSPERNVGDVLTACDVVSLSGPGRFGLRWQFRRDQIEASVSAAGDVEINVDSHDEQGRPARDRLSAKLSAPLKPGDRIGFAVRDGQAYVVHNNRAALLLPFGPQDAESAKSDSREPPAPCRLSLFADRCRVSLSRIVLVRDVYYAGGDEDDEFWGGRGTRDQPVTLGETEYFVLGDNSSLSKDSRFYEDLQSSDLIGTARWIYWPRKRWRAFQ